MTGFKTIKVVAQAVDIGGVSEVSGNAQINRGKAENKAGLDSSIQSNDKAVTTNGRIAITFLDDSQVKLTEHSQLTIDEYVFDADPSKAKMALTFGLGTARFITGKLGKIDRRNITLKTPTADIAIRGTDFTATVDELGRSLIILLPNQYGVSSGEIEVITAMGTVFTEERIGKTANILDFNALDIDYLAEDYLAGDDLEFTELDINFLDVNYLEDLLNILDALGVAEEEDKLAQVSGVTVTGTSLGIDADTQITTLITGQTISLIRGVSEYSRLDLNIAGGYTVILIQDGVSNVIKINGGDSTIRILQEG